MPRRITNRLKFTLERLMLRGPQYRLLIIAALIGLLSMLGGALAYFFDPDWDRSSGIGYAIWWAFLRLSDPGYLGDDIGTIRRTVGTVLTVLGYVVFLGALVAIMTQWLNARMRELEAGLTPIAHRDHILITGWTNRTATIVGELLLSAERVRRFLQYHGARTLRIAILADEVTEAMGIELRDRLGSLWSGRRVILRTGSPLRIEHLQRVDFTHASAVIMPAADFDEGGPDQADARTVKTLLSMTNQPLAERDAELPLVVAEIFDSRKIEVARRAYGGPIEILASDAIIARLLAQTVRHRGLSYIYTELLTHGHGCEIYVRGVGNLNGVTVRQAQLAFPRAVLLGVVCKDGDSYDPQLNPPADKVLRADDKLALLAHNYAATEPTAVTEAATPALPALTTPTRSAPDAAQRLLVLGWNHKVPALLHQFDSYLDERFEIDVVTTTPRAVRAAAYRRFEFAPRHVRVRQIEADFTTETVLRRLGVATYDNIILLGSDRLSSGEESDARTIVAYLQLNELLPAENAPHVLVELLDASNRSLFHHGSVEVIVSPVLLSHMLAQVALRRELRSVFDDVFGPAGAEIVFRSPADYGLHGERRFHEVETAAARRAELALGMRSTRAGTHLRDIELVPDRDRTFALRDGIEIVALSTDRTSSEGRARSAVP